MSRGQWGWLTRSNDWETVYDGVARRAGAPRTWEQAEMAGCLCADGIASHRAAGILWRLPEIEPRLEITIPQRRKVVLDGFAVHRTRFLQPVDLAHRSGIPVTSLARTVIDVSLEVPRIAPGLVNHVLAKRKVPLALLVDRLEAQGTRGRRGAADLFELLEERRGRQRHVDSELQRQLEQIALHGYKAGLLPEPFFEYPVQLANGRWRYPDVAYPPPVSVGFEAHSYEHHSSLEAFAADAERNLELFGEGWMIVPITGVQVRDSSRLLGLMARIVAAAQARRG
ncbi:MAG: hypothetical protein JWM17_221 [Actinobacteria bacterium]|nr:hypothetical protein [Actinomycetota bacterium]MCW3042701.1 hypothetical protein [Actinomycetota bacterium]